MHDALAGTPCRGVAVLWGPKVHVFSTAGYSAHVGAPFLCSGPLFCFLRARLSPVFVLGHRDSTPLRTFRPHFRARAPRFNPSAHVFGPKCVCSVPPGTRRTRFRPKMLLFSTTWHKCLAVCRIILTFRPVIRRKSWYLLVQ